ncbi:MAG: archaellin/type IV pilin N-terminal domain-containing protein [Thermoplasmata archaeon]
MKRRVLKNEAVSPVIATILMVAITVVLAATLYMMLPKGGDSGTQQSGSFGGTEKTQDADGYVAYQIKFASFSPSRAISELTFRVESPNNGSSVVEFNADDDDTSVALTDNLAGHTLTYTDQVDNQEVNSGDSITISNDAVDAGLEDDTWEVIVLYDGSEVDSTSFRVT